MNEVRHPEVPRFHRRGEGSRADRFQRGRPVRPSKRFGLGLAATFLWICGALCAQAQTASSSPCSADGPRDESGFLHCCPDGSAPRGESQCWCEPKIVHLRTYRNPKHEYEVQVPDGMAEILGCSGTGAGFKISLTHPDTGKSEGNLPLNMIWVGATGGLGEPFQKFFERWFTVQSEDSERIHATDLQIDQPEQTSLSSLPAFDLKLARTEPEAGRMVYEVIIAEDPDKDTAYQIGLVTPADQYTKNEKLFKAIAEGFRYAPSKQADK
jgi:hypothetical protein